MMLLRRRFAGGFGIVRRMHTCLKPGVNERGSEPWVLLVVMVVGVAWFFVTGMWRPGAWHYPLAYDGDAPATHAWVKAAGEGGLWPWCWTVSRLGAPNGAVWTDYPIYDKHLLWCLGKLAKGIGI